MLYLLLLSRLSRSCLGGSRRLRYWRYIIDLKRGILPTGRYKLRNLGQIHTLLCQQSFAGIIRVIWPKVTAHTEELMIRQVQDFKYESDGYKVRLAQSVQYRN